MMEQSSRDRLRSGYPEMAVRAHRFWQDVKNHLGLELRVTEVVRTLEYQAKLYARGRTESGSKVTNAKPGESIHHYGLAFDICFVGKDPYLELIKAKDPLQWDLIWRKVGLFGIAHGLTWGYDWNANGQVDKNDFDRPHFQVTYGLTLQSIQSLYKFGGMAAVWAKCDQIRGVEQASEWNGILTKRELADAGILP